MCGEESLDHNQGWLVNGGHCGGGGSKHLNTSLFLKILKTTVLSHGRQTWML